MVATILIQPLSTQLTTLAAATAMVDASTQTDAFNLNALIDRASAIITAYCGRPFGLRTVSEVFHLPWHSPHGLFGHHVTQRDYPPLILTHFPVVGVISVTEDAVTLTTDQWEIDTGLLYRLNYGDRGCWNAQKVTIVYEAGYTLPNDDVDFYTLPLEIEDVCLQLVQSGFFNQASNPAVILEVTEGVGRVGYTKSGVTAMALDASLQSQLAPHKARLW